MINITMKNWLHGNIHYSYFEIYPKKWNLIEITALSSKYNLIVKVSYKKHSDFRLMISIWCWYAPVAISNLICFVAALKYITESNTDGDFTMKLEA